MRDGLRVGVDSDIRTGRPWPASPRTRCRADENEETAAAFWRRAQNFFHVNGTTNDETQLSFAGT
jgi:hypothetical protein